MGVTELFDLRLRTGDRQSSFLSPPAPTPPLNGACSACPELLRCSEAALDSFASFPNICKSSTSWMFFPE